MNGTEGVADQLDEFHEWARGMSVTPDAVRWRLFTGEEPWMAGHPSNIGRGKIVKEMGDNDQRP